MFVLPKTSLNFLHKTQYSFQGKEISQAIFLLCDCFSFCRVIRQSPLEDGTLSVKPISDSLRRYCEGLARLEEALNNCPAGCEQICLRRIRGQRSETAGARCLLFKSAGDLMFEELGFELGVRPSGMPGAGRGVFVERGVVKEGHLAALYPGQLQAFTLSTSLLLLEF